jgi:hypothetical protein
MEKSKNTVNEKTKLLPVPKMPMCNRKMISDEFPGYTENHEGQETTYKKLKPWFINQLVKTSEKQRIKNLMEKTNDKKRKKT